MYVLFVFILVNNLIGMVPYSFASTSHFILTFSLSFTVVLGATILGFQKHGLKFFSLFVPSGCPLGLLPLLVLIEFISYLSRNVSLGLRLAANILSGHMLLNILAGFTYNIMTSGVIFFFLGLIPLSFIIAFSGLELGIAFIQAQVFVVLNLPCSGLNPRERKRLYSRFSRAPEKPTDSFPQGVDEATATRLLAGTSPKITLLIVSEFTKTYACCFS